MVSLQTPSLNLTRRVRIYWAFVTLILNWSPSDYGLSPDNCLNIVVERLLFQYSQILKVNEWGREKEENDQEIKDSYPITTLVSDLTSKEDLDEH